MEKMGLLKNDKMGNYEKEQGFASYRTLVDYYVGDIVLCNNIIEILQRKRRRNNRRRVLRGRQRLLWDKHAWDISMVFVQSNTMGKRTSRKSGVDSII